MEQVRELWQEVHGAVQPYPCGVVEVPEAIKGTAFFPGGYGLWIADTNRLPQLPKGQIMIVGQDFNSKATYDKARALGTESGSSKTWRELRKILESAGIKLEQCFFTNVYMGLRESGPETGGFPGVRDKAFASRCLAFFDLQLEVVQPKLILLLGKEPLRALSTKFKVRAPLCDVSLPHGSATVVALTHPSLYAANVWRRRFGELTGSQAELEMIKVGLRTAFPSGL